PEEQTAIKDLETDLRGKGRSHYGMWRREVVDKHSSPLEFLGIIAGERVLTSYFSARSFDFAIG
ncbi:MAG TPA: hypothetical protein PLM48_03950, partial [Clostridia bacterium]|nr:hypothetical protein [Clostridia bacterium]